MAHTGTGIMEIAEMLCWYCLLGINLKSFVYSFLLALFIECLRRKLKKKKKKEREE